MDYPLYEVPKSNFPRALVEIPDVPAQLYARGKLPPKEHRLLAIVGARKYSTYGKQVVERIVSGLSGHPITIVSGLAIGIDMLAHKAALTYHINTLAVPGSGLHDAVLYPRQNRILAYEILKAGGGLLSEFEPNFRATPWSFPQRNRIMAGIAHAVLVIEATRKSGTLITARLATDYNRDVLTVPGSIFSENSVGPHLLISLGATPITSADDVLTALNLPTEKRAVDFSQLSPRERAVMECLSTPQSRDSLMRALPLRIEEAQALIMMMELQGYIREVNGVYIRT